MIRPLRPLLFLLAALPLGCAAPAFAQTETLADLSFPVRDGQSLAVDVIGGDVAVETTAGSQASVVVRGTGPGAAAEFETLRFTAEMRGDVLSVRTRRPRRGYQIRRGVRFSYTLRVPQRFDVSVDTGSGAVSVGALVGNVSVDTGSGSVRVADVQGNLSVDTGSGSVRTSDVRGNVSIDTGSGSVRVGRVVGRLAVDTGSGSVQVEEQDGPAVIDTGSGSATIRLARVAALLVDTGSGSATVVLPRGAAADLHAEGDTVTLDSAFAFSGRRERDEVVGRIGGGGERIRIDTGSGAVRIQAR